VPLRFSRLVVCFANYWAKTAKNSDTSCEG